jgi:hypothetical protein
MIFLKLKMVGLFFIIEKFLTGDIFHNILNLLNAQKETRRKKFHSITTEQYQLALDNRRRRDARTQRRATPLIKHKNVWVHIAILTVSDAQKTHTTAGPEKKIHFNDGIIDLKGNNSLDLCLILEINRSLPTALRATAAAPRLIDF